MRATADLAGLELDLEVFSGPFDLLLTLVLREEVDLLEVDLAGVVVAYLDHLEARGDLDLEVATEFLVLITALLELKSRLLLPRPAAEPEDELGPAEAAEELLERLIAHRRHRAAAEYLVDRLAGESGHRFRRAPPPAWAAEVPVAELVGVHPPARLTRALGGLLRVPEPVSLRHVTVPRVSLSERVRVLRELLRHGSFSFGAAVAGADRTTVAMTLWALLELYRQGEADWDQPEAFGAIAVRARPARDRVVRAVADPDGRAEALRAAA